MDKWPVIRYEYMKIFKYSLFMLFLVSLSACTLPVTVSILNNTLDRIIVIADGDSIEIETDKSKRMVISGISSAFTISIKNELMRYTAIDIPLEHVHWKRRGPFSKRMFYIQIDTDGRIWVLKNKAQKAMNSHITQPKGFPLEPNV